MGVVVDYAMALMMMMTTWQQSSERVCQTMAFSDASVDRREKANALLHHQLEAYNIIKPNGGHYPSSSRELLLNTAGMAKGIEESSPPSAPVVPSPPFRGRLLFFLLLLCSCFSSPIASQGTAPGAAADADEQRRVLLQMKAEWKDPPSLSTWTTSTSPCDGTWNGIQCGVGGDDGSVTTISLVEQGIEGAVPAATCGLKNLSSLNLFNNSVGGDFPAVLYNCSNLQHLNLSQNLFVGGIPSDVDRLSKLAVLDLSSNNFSGDVPAAIARIPGLRQLRLDNNLFDGTFPKELGSMPGLEYLTLANNPFRPMELPAEFGNLTRLKYLWVSEANLVGEIPERLGNLTDLEHLDLANNNLEGGIPGGIWQLEKLQFLYLYNNQLSGTIAAGAIAATGLTEIDLSTNRLNGSIPEGFGKLLNLRLLFLYYNRLSGGIPDGIASTPALADIRLFNNSLTGGLPPDLGKHSKLLNLEVSDNMLSGELPEGLCAGGAFNSLVAFNNNFTGGLPSSLGDCPELKSLQVHGNGLSGEVPLGIWSSPKLFTVRMRGNKLSGDLPESLPPSLSRLEIGDNRFSGEIPSSSPSLQVFWASNNLFSGEIPSDLKGMSQLLELFLDGNQISGQIPPGIGSLRSLTSLNLRGNQLTGSIPGAVGTLPVLTSLDLSGNRLSGEIPKEMGGLKLNYLNLSSNSLSGQIPPALQNQAYDRSFLSNPGLCASSSAALNLPPCGSGSGGSGRLPKGLLILFLLLGFLLFLATVLFGYFAVRYQRRRKDADDLASWKLTSFQSVGFTESSIARGLTAGNLVGSGRSGQVYRVSLGNRAGWEVVAVKKIWNNKKLDGHLEKEFEAEVKILGSIRHANIVRLLCCISSPDSKLLVYEYMDNGSLYQWLHGQIRGGAAAGETALPGLTKEGVLSWPARLRIAVGAARGLCYMHHECSPPVVHRDVNSSNILLDSELKPRVADFGLARFLERPGEADTVSTIAGSFGYMAPECAYSRKVSEKVDVYSFGVVLLELTTGKKASGGDGHSSLAEWAWLQFKEGNSVTEALDEEIREPLYLEEMSVVMRLGLFCTGTSPSTRPSMKEVLQVLLRFAQGHGDGDKPVAQEYDDVAPPLSDARKKNSWRKRLSDAGDGEDEESSLARSV